MTRGDVVVLATKGPYTGKPRPGVIVQANRFNGTHASVTVCLLTSDWADAPLFRVAIPPGERTGLNAASQVMVDKIASVPRSAIARIVGRCDEDEMQAVDAALRYWLDL